MGIKLTTENLLTATNANRRGIGTILSRRYVANIAPAVDGIGDWNFAAGPLILSNSGNWTLKFPENTTLNFRMWGGGGAYGSPVGALGGGGGFVSGQVAFTTDSDYTLTVAGGGNGTVGGFGGGGVGNTGQSGGGGGYSGIFRGANTFANVVVIAAGGGGSGANDSGAHGAGGAAGGTSGTPGGTSPVAGAQGSGGTQGAGGGGGAGGGAGSPGVALRGGNGGIRPFAGSAGGGGGGGYYGGGGGAGVGPSSPSGGGGGGGGSSYVSPLYTLGTTILPGANANAGGNTDPFYSGAGIGGTAPSRNGANGMIYIFLA